VRVDCRPWDEPRLTVHERGRKWQAMIAVPLSGHIVGAYPAYKFEDCWYYEVISWRSRSRERALGRAQRWLDRREARLELGAELLVKRNAEAEQEVSRVD